MKFDLLDVPFKKFRLTDEITFGNDLRENNIEIADALIFKAYLKTALTTEYCQTAIH